MKTIDEMIEVMVAAKDGKTIQARRHGRCADAMWVDAPVVGWNWGDFDYRVKPEPRRWRGHTTLDGGFISCDHANCKLGASDWVEVVEVLK